MKFYKINVEKNGARLLYPEVGHKNYKNIGYNLDLSECIWKAENNVEMPVSDSNCNEITAVEKDDLLAQWETEKQVQQEE